MAKAVREWIAAIGASTAYIEPVGLVRERFFTPRLRFKSYDEMNAWLTDHVCERLASPAGLEPATPGLGNQCSIRLSYGDVPGTYPVLDRGRRRTSI